MSYGRGGATTAQWDLTHSDCIMIQGSNMAECHPVAFRFVMEARERGAKIIHVDPRYTRTSASADLYAPIRPGTDIAFLGGLINYVIQRERYFKEYVLAYTNASTLISKDYKDSEDLDGIFSGFDPEKRQYSADTWAYRGEAEPASGEQKPARTGETFAEHAIRSTPEPPPRDETLQDPMCVFQILKRHFARYTPEMVERVCGTPQDVFLQIAETLCENSGRDRTAAFCYAVGWTQHTTGVQNIRAGAILQLLLGNIGRPGGGILALRGHAAIQGSTDIPTLYNLLPGYIPMPLEDEPALDDNLKEYTAAAGWWRNYPKYMVSLLKSWYGEHATAQNEWDYQYLPKLRPNQDYSYYPMMFAMLDKQIKGLFVMGENFAAGGPGAILERNALRSLEWCVVREPFLVETAQFWQMDGANPADVETEVFFLPSAWAAEKDGSLTNTQRMLQWHDKAVDPPGDCRSESWFMVHLGRRLRALYQSSREERDAPLLRMLWDYPTEGALQEPVMAEVLREINGYTVSDGKNVSGYLPLKADGSTACGCWIYSGVMPESGKNLAAARVPDAPGHYANHQGWGFAWPANRRIIYNRASADPDGNPWSERKRLVWWDKNARDGKGQWTGLDVPDFTRTFAPHANPNESTEDNPDETEGLSGGDPFIMHADGRGWLFAPHGLKDGPLPVYYEPVESPLPNLIYPKYPVNPSTTFFQRPENPYNGHENPQYPYIMTTYRLTEHHTSGAMSRWNTWLSELQPEFFIELDPELAREKEIAQNDWVTVWTARGEIEARAMVTRRLLPVRAHGRTLHVIGVPYHFGPAGVVTGDIANDLIGVMLDPNVHIHEAKALTCNLRKGRKGGHEGANLRREVAALRVNAAHGGAAGRAGSEGAQMRLGLRPSRGPQRG
jgi:formate dehydrogenase major subunit